MNNWQLIVTLAILVGGQFGAAALLAGLTNKRIEDLKTYFDAKFDTLRSESRADIAGLRAESRAEVAGLRAEIAGLRAEIHALADRVARIEKLIEPFVRLVMPGKN